MTTLQQSEHHQIVPTYTFVRRQNVVVKYVLGNHSGVALVAVDLPEPEQQPFRPARSVEVIVLCKGAYHQSG